jgi:maleate isomerase
MVGSTHSLPVGACSSKQKQYRVGFVIGKAGEAHVILRDILRDLLRTTAASRTTLRLGLPERNLHVDRVVAEVVAPGVRHIGEDSSIDQRELPTVKYIEEERRILVQNDCLAADPAPPRALIDFYGVKAQMLGPIVRDDRVIGWISVHYTLGFRMWGEEDVAALQEALERVQQELTFWQEER